MTPGPWRIALEGVEAAVAVARQAGRRRIDGLEIPQHLVDRRVQAVGVEPVESCAGIGSLLAWPSGASELSQ